MKYEEWIKYEEARQNQPPELAWMVWVEFPGEDRPLAVNFGVDEAAGEDLPGSRLWTMILQYLNSRRI